MRTFTVLLSTVLFIGLVTLSSCSGEEKSSNEEPTTSTTESAKTPPAADHGHDHDHAEESEPVDQETNDAITKTIDQIYGEGMPFYRWKELMDFFVPSLRDLLGDVSEVEEWSKSKAAPDEKPAMIEGAVFSSLYEGFDSYTIKNILVENYAAQVTIEFSHTMGETTSWEDIILLEKHTQWQLDNVIYNQEIHNGEPDLRKALYKFTVDNS